MSLASVRKGSRQAEGPRARFPEVKHLVKMTLSTRLSLFFLAALAFVLVGFSTCLYICAHYYLNRQANERLQADLNTLTAAAEIEAHGVEWEPHQRRLALGRHEDSDTLRWVITDDQGRFVDCSPGSADLVSEGLNAAREVPDHRGVEVAYQGQSWLLAQRRVDGPPGRQGPETVEDHPAASPKTYPALIFQAAVSLEPVRATLRGLAFVLMALSLGLWLSAALLGRRLCRRALRPLTSMAQTARTLSAEDLARRLPSPGTGDELDDLGNAFNDLLARLNESFERQRRFTGDASHQLRTPLTAMLGQVEVALRRSRAPEEYQGALRSVHRQALQLREIVEMLLFLARADAEARLPHLETINLSSWLEERTKAWSEHPRHADFLVEILPDQGLWVRVQTPLLAQLVDNLLDNACKYSEPGTTIRIKAWGEPGAVCLCVEDQGAGIHADDLPHLFEPFYRSPHARRHGVSGVGLGLAVARRIAEAFAGRVLVDSELGQGTRFTLQLPAETSALKITDNR